MEKENQRYLLTFDFDKTIANTFEPSPNGVGVLKAYDMSITSIFGNEGFDIYKNKLNGLENRAPSELVDLLIKSGNEKKLLEQASDFFNTHSLRLLSLLPEEDKNDNNLNWDEMSEKLLDTLTWMLAAEKCSFLSSEIGKELPNHQIWPRPCVGFPDFYKSIDEINSRGDIKIDKAIISSGHTEFIKKTFKTYNLKLPNYIITDDELRQVRDVPIKEKTKPGTYPFEVIHKKWMADNNLSDVEDRTKIIYFGDDPKKDGAMADNCRVSFGCFDKESKYPFIKIDNGFSFNNWQVPEKLLHGNTSLLVRGEPIAKIFNHEKK